MSSDDGEQRQQSREPSLAGRVVLVTGASSGLGARFARTLAGAGAAVALAARRSERIEALAGELRAMGARAAAVRLDVEDEASVIAGFNAAEGALGPIDALVNNAGMNEAGLAVELGAAAFDKVFAVNVRGVFLCAREAARRMIARGGARDGRIVNIASIGATTALPGLAAYCASKAAVVMLTKSLALEWARHGINVNAICPGYIETEINSDWLASDGGRKMVQGFARRRVMPINAIDDIAVLLIGPGGAHVTGSAFQIDDGQSL